VGAIQFCYDFCSAEISATGWIWAGGGVVRKALWGSGEAFYGAYVFAEKEFGKWQTDWPRASICGPCVPECKPDGTLEWGAGFTGFPKIIKPDERIQVKASGVELGVLLHPHANLCEADLEAIALIDITRWLGLIGRAVRRRRTSSTSGASGSTSTSTPASASRSAARCTSAAGPRASSRSTWPSCVAATRAATSACRATRPSCRAEAIER
jgi:hypothetical protein